MSFDYIFLLVVGIVILTIWCNSSVEKMSNTTLSPDVISAVKQVYNADVQAIRNLSDVATRLQAGGLTIPGQLSVQNDLNIGGTLNVRRGNRSFQAGTEASNYTYLDLTSLDSKMNDFDVRLSSSGGDANGASGQGTFGIEAKNIKINNRTEINRPAGASADPDLVLKASNQWTHINNHMGGGNYNSITQQGDHGIIFSNGAINDDPGFVIAPWHGGNSGIRITKNGTRVANILNVDSKVIVGGRDILAELDAIKKELNDNVVKYNIDVSARPNPDAGRCFDFGSSGRTDCSNGWSVVKLVRR